MIGIIGAMSIEVDALKALCENKEIETISGIEYVKGTLCGKKVVIATCGIGKVNSAICAQTMLLNFKPSLLINTGVAGSLSNELDIGDIAIPHSAVEADFDLSPLGMETGYIPEIKSKNISCTDRVVKRLTDAAKKEGLKVKSGIVATTDAFISGKDKKDYLAKNFNAVACEMEGGSIAHTAYLNGVDFAIIRAVSDKADGSSHMDFMKFCKMAAENSVKLICRFIGEME